MSHEPELCHMTMLLPWRLWKWLLRFYSLQHAATAKSLQSCPTLHDPTDGSPPGSPVPGILQARTLEWVAISFSSAWKWKVKVKSLSRVQLLATPGTAAHQAPPSMGFSRQEYWSGVPLIATYNLGCQAEWCDKWKCIHAHFHGILCSTWPVFWLVHLIHLHLR